MVRKSASRDAVSVISEFCRCSEITYNQLIEEESKMKTGEKYKRGKGIIGGEIIRGA